MRMAHQHANSSTSFLYVYSCDLTTNLQVKICDLEGLFRDVQSPIRKIGQLFVQATVYCNDRMVGYPVCTAFKPSPQPLKARQKLLQSWAEWITLPIRYCDLSRDASINFSVYDLDVEKDQSNLELLDDTLSSSASSQILPNRLVAQSSMPLFSKRGVLKAGTIDLQVEVCSKEDPLHRCEESWKMADSTEDHMDFLHKQVGRQQRNLVDSEQWLDPFTLKKVEEMRAKRKYSKRSMFLVIEMPSVRYGAEKYDIVYFEYEPDMRVISVGGGTSRSTGDPELGLDNLCEAKHTVMTRNARAGIMDRHIKPNKTMKDKLDYIIKLPSSQQLSREQRDIVWKFRYFLQADRHALNKYLQSVNWDHQTEVQAALSLLNDWSAIEAEDALELLSPDFTHPAVRAYAVSRLFDAASSDQVLLFLPQLVQALKYEPETPVEQVAHIIERMDSVCMVDEGDEVLVEDDDDVTPMSDDLASFLIKYAKGYPHMANFLYWHLKVEADWTLETDVATSRMYERIMNRLLTALRKGSTAARSQAESLDAQKRFVDDLKVITNEAKARSSRRDVRESTLRTMLTKAKHLTDLKGLILPLDPTIKLAGVLPDSASMFNSAMMPVKLTLKTTNKVSADQFNEYTLIFKQGDDLRQDQLVIQMIRLMDSLFKKNQLDLKLTPYAVLATGKDEGFVQFVKARPLRDVINKYAAHKMDSIKEAMRETRPDSSNELGIEADVIDNYVRSLAGYSVVCYVLGVGDRHLDNLLLCENGKLFHVDFGFILGRDPKPLPPPMKLTGEMIQAMGGLKSSQFRDFLMHCDSAYSILRRHANVLLNLFSLMLDAGIPDIAVEKDKAVSKVEQRLRLDLNDEAAFKYIGVLIEESMNAKMPIIADIIHGWKQNLAW